MFIACCVPDVILNALHGFSHSISTIIPYSAFCCRVYFTGKEIEMQEDAVT